MKRLFGVALMAVVMMSAARVWAIAANSNMVAKVNAGELTRAKASWWGFDGEDSTDALQAALDSKASVVVIDKMASDWQTRPLFIRRDNLTVEFEDGAVLMAKKGAFIPLNDCLILVKDVKNVKLCGNGTLRMRQADYVKPPYVKGEWRACLYVHHTDGLVIDGLRFEESGGDGITFSLGARNIVVRNVVCDRNFRQGISVCSGSNLLIEHCQLLNTKGTAPSSGIDFEPDVSDGCVDNCVMRDCLLKGNDGTGVDICLNNLSASSVPVSLTIENCRMEGNSAGTAIRVSRQVDFVSGEVNFKRCVFVENRAEGIGFERKAKDAVKIVFDHCKILDCCTGGKGADIRFFPTSWDEPLSDGIEFRDLAIRQKFALPWIAKSTSNFAKRPTAITGRVFVRNPEQSVTTNVFDAALLAKLFPDDGVAPYPREDMDYRKVQVIDRCPGKAIRLSDLTFQSDVAFRFYVARAGEVTFKARRVPPRPDMYVKPNGVAHVNGIYHSFYAPVTIPGSEPSNMTFKVDRAGWYTMRVSSGFPNCFHLMESTCPIALLTDYRAVMARAPAGEATVWFDAPAKKMPFSLALSGTGGGNFVKAEVFDPAGKRLAADDEVRDCWTTLRVPEGTSEGLSRIVFSRSPNHAFWYFLADLTGLPSVFFLSPEKCWHWNGEHVKTAPSKPATRLIDTCWMWGHETGQVDGTNNIWKLDVASKYYPMTEGAKSFGIDSLNVVRWDRPDRAFRETLKGMRRVTWPVSGVALWGSVGFDELADWCFKVADEQPNVSGFDLDDFFMPDGKTQLVVETPKGPRKSCPTRFPYAKLRELRRRMNGHSRPLELRLVTYDGLLEQCVDPHDLQPSFDMADTLTYWTWKAQDLDKMPQNFARVKALAPGKRIDLGIYLYDFGATREMPSERMKLQLRLGLDLWKRGEINGFVFLCSSICNRDFAAVRIAREWLRQHGNETRR